MLMLERMVSAMEERSGRTIPVGLLEPLAKAALLAIRTPTMDAGLIGAPIITYHMKGNADYFAAKDSFTAIIDAILEGKA